MAKFFKKLSKKILKSKPVTALAGWLIYLYTKLAKATIKWHIEGLDQTLHFLDQGNKVIVLLWHGRAMMVASFWTHKNPLNALVSLHQDGRLIANFLKHLKVETIGGSTTSNARGSALNLVRSLQNETSIAMVPDGPRGPNQILSRSPIYFAQKTNTPIIHATYSVKNSKILKKSWDQTMLPKLFSKGILLVSEPIYIPQDLNDEQIEQYRLQVENQMNELQNRADDYTQMPHIIPGQITKKKKRDL